MIAYFTAPGSYPFTVALLVMLGLLAFEIISLINGLGANDVIDDFIVSNVDMPEGGYALSGEWPDGAEPSGVAESGSAVGHLLAWLYVGRVPVLMVLIVFLTVFGLAGLMVQFILREAMGMAIPGVIAAPVVFFASLPLVRACAGGLARILPGEESSAISTATFVGRTAIMVGGNARTDLPAQARLTDRFGTTHYVMVEPEEPDQVLENGSLVLIVRRLDSRFTAIPNPNAALDDRAR